MPMLFLLRPMACYSFVPVSVWCPLRCTAVLMNIGGFWDMTGWSVHAVSYPQDWNVRILSG